MVFFSQHIVAHVEIGSRDFQGLILPSNKYRLECPSRFNFFSSAEGAEDGVAWLTSLVRACD